MDLRSHEFRPIQPQDYILYTCGYAYPRTSYPEIRAEILQFYNDVFGDPDIVEYRLATLASCLWGIRKQEEFMVLKGEGRNGKGTECELIMQAFGEYFHSFKSTQLTHDDQGKDSPNANFFKCFAKRYL